MAMVLWPRREVALGVGLLEEFAASVDGYGIKDAGVGDARLSVVGDELVSVCLIRMPDSAQQRS